MTQTIPQFKNEPIVVLLLGFVTCGLYLIYWNIKAAEVINAVAEKEIISQPIAIFAGCCLPVNLYFYYLAGKEGLPKNRQEFFDLKRMGFADKRLAKLSGLTEKEVRELRCGLGINPSYKRVDSCAAEFDSVTSYMYSTYEE